MINSQKESLPLDCILEKELNSGFIDLLCRFIKNIIALIFLPFYLVISLFENRLFSTFLKQILFFLYLLSVIVFIYTFLNYSRKIGSEEKLVRDIPYLDKIREIK